MFHSPPDTVTSRQDGSWDGLTIVDEDSEISKAAGLEGGVGVEGTSLELPLPVSFCSVSVSPSTFVVVSTWEFVTLDVTDSCVLNDEPPSLALMLSSPIYQYH